MENCTVKVYILNCEMLADGGLFRRYYDTVPQQRKDKIDRAKLDSDKRLLLGAGILIEKALAGYETANIQTGEHGKPYIPDCPHRFNVSHSGDVAMLALADCEVGCDVQLIKPFSEKAAKRFFAPEEYDALINADDKTEAFYRIWALKESYVKATGRGLSQPLNEFAVTLGDKPFVNEDYALTEPGIAPGYAAAVCAKTQAEVHCKVIACKL